MDSDLQKDKAVIDVDGRADNIVPPDGGMEIVARVRDTSSAIESPSGENDSLLHTVIQHMRDFVILVDHDLRVIAINDAAINCLSLPRQLRGSKLSIDLFSDIVHDGLTGKPLDEDTWLFGRVLRGESVQADPRVIVFPDGSRRDFLVQCSPIFGSDGQVAMGLVVGWDVTSVTELQKKTEAALSDATMQHDNLSRLVDNMVMGVMFVDSTLRILQVNRAYARMFAPDVDLRLGACIADVLPMAEESGILSVLLRALKSERPVRVQNFRYEGLSRGTTYWNGSAVPVRIRGANGPETGLAMVMLDVTEEVKARSQLAEMAQTARSRATKLGADRAWLDTIIQSTPVPLMVVMRNREVQIYNSAAQSLCEELGLNEWIERRGSFREVKGLELLDEDGEPIGPLSDPLTRSLRGKTCSGHLMQVRAGHGPFKWLLVNSAPLHETRGVPGGAVLAIHDVTEERRAQEQVSQAYQREHAIADKLQSSFMPGGLQSIEGFEIGHGYQTGLDEALVGGDFYDVFRLGPKKLGLVVADVAGKGLKAAVYTAMTKYMLRAYALEESAPELALARLNEALTACTPPEVFVTLIYGILDGLKRTLTYANAGHEQPILCSNGMALNLDVTGRALGLMHGSIYSTREVEFRQGDLVIVYTDGITDAGAGCNRLGTEAMLRIAENCTHSPAQAVADRLVGAALEFCGGHLSDDAAVLVVKAVGHEDGG